MDSTNVGYATDASTSGNVGAADGVLVLVMTVIVLAVTILMVVGMWKLFVKAGRPGWASIVPFYNTYVMVELAGRPIWWFAVILLVPILNVVFGVIVTIDFVKAYGKSTAYGVFSLFFPFITLPIMAFDDKVRYIGRGVAPVPAAQASFAQPNPPAAEPTVAVPASSEQFGQQPTPPQQSQQPPQQ